MESEPRYTLTESDILHFALCLRSRHTADLSANEAIEHWRTDHGITPAPVDGDRDAAFMTAIDIARGSRQPPAGMPAYQAISRIQLFLCGHGDGAPGTFEPWMEWSAAPQEAEG